MSTWLGRYISFGIIIKIQMTTFIKGSSPLIPFTTNFCRHLPHHTTPATYISFEEFVSVFDGYRYLIKRRRKHPWGYKPFWGTADVISARHKRRDLYHAHHVDGQQVYVETLCRLKCALHWIKYVLFLWSIRTNFPQLYSCSVVSAIPQKSLLKVPHRKITGPLVHTALWI